MVEEIDYEGLDHDSLAINMLAGAMAGISEHAVMYPVDSIKVRLRAEWVLMTAADSCAQSLYPLPLLPCTDSHASAVNFTRSGLQQHVRRVHANLIDRRHTAIMAWRRFGHLGRRSGSRCVLWHLRAGEGACRRECEGIFFHSNG